MEQSIVIKDNTSLILPKLSRSKSKNKSRIAQRSRNKNIIANWRTQQTAKRPDGNNSFDDFKSKTAKYLPKARKVKFNWTPERKVSLTIRDVTESDAKLWEAAQHKLNNAYIYMLMDKALPKYAPKGAAISMSPWLLANTFWVDFYELYKQQLDEGDEMIQNMLKRNDK